MLSRLIAAVDNRCFRCGQKTPGHALSCPACGAGLLVDVLADVQVTDSRLLYLAAREVDELGGDAPTFAEVKTRLEAAPGAVVRGCSRALARSISAALHRHGVIVRVVPVRRPRSPAAAARSTDIVGRMAARLRIWNRNLPVSIKLAGAGLAVALGLFLTLHRWAAVEVAQDPSEHAAPAAGERLSSREITFAAISSTVRLRCSGSSGAGFFIDPERIVTNEHLLFPRSASVEVELGDGRKLDGTVERADAWLDLATIRVPGAGAQGLTLGDATALEQGDQVLAIGAPVGLDLAVAQGVVSQPSRVIMGISYLQVDAATHPGSSGGPILDRSGRVVAVTATAGPASSVRGLAIPVNYLYSGEDPLLPRARSRDERSRWEARIADTASRELEELAELRASAGRPALNSAELVPRGMVRVVVFRIASLRPLAEQLHFSLLGDGIRLCEPSAEVSSWQPAAEQVAQIDDSRFLRWLARHDLRGKVFVASSRLDLRGCPGPGTVVGSELVLSNGDARADRVTVADSMGSVAAVR